MSGDRYVAARDEAIDCVTSLHIAMQDAGGSLLDYETLKSMTLMDFITTVAAQNHIRFYFKNPKD